jgi:hypothetical protein
MKGKSNTKKEPFVQIDPETDLLFLLCEVALQMRTCADRMAREHGMTPTQWAILAPRPCQHPFTGAGNLNYY